MELGSYSETYTAGPQETHAIQLDMPLDPKFAGVTVDSLKLDIYSHATRVGGRGVEHDDPVSFITIPAFQ